MIGPETVRNIARLARLAITPDEAAQFTGQLNNILSHVEKLNQVDTEGVAPTTHVLSLSNVFREDQVQPSLPMEEGLKAAPEREGPYFRVPKIIE